MSARTQEALAVALLVLMILASIGIPDWLVMAR